MSDINIYMAGVGGQGIGMLSEVLTRACLAAGHTVNGCDTHGLAQRGGTVISHLRLGDGARTPRVPAGKADLVVALERLEAHRGATVMLKDGGTVIYYDAEYQPIHVRMGLAKYPGPEDLAVAVERKNGKVERVFFARELPSPRMQNIALLARVGAHEVIEGVGVGLIREAASAALPPEALETNLAVFDQAASRTVGR